jgi:hypothetical protein
MRGVGHSGASSSAGSAPSVRSRRDAESLVRKRSSASPPGHHRSAVRGDPPARDREQGVVGRLRRTVVAWRRRGTAPHRRTLHGVACSWALTRRRRAVRHVLVRPPRRRSAFVFGADRGSPRRASGCEQWSDRSLSAAMLTGRVMTVIVVVASGFPRGHIASSPQLCLGQGHRVVREAAGERSIRGTVRCRATARRV